MIMPTHTVTAAGIVENGQGEILLVNTHHGGWVFPGGQVEAGENIIDAVIREIKEEVCWIFLNEEMRNENCRKTCRTLLTKTGILCNNIPK